MIVNLSNLRKQMAANLGESTLGEVSEELGLSMDDSVIDDSDNHSVSRGSVR